MESEDVLILSVDTSAELVYLGTGKKRADKGKAAADPSRRQYKKSQGGDKQNCLVILDDNGGDYVEMYGGDVAKDASGKAGGADDDLECLVSLPKRAKTFEEAEQGASRLQAEEGVVIGHLTEKEDSLDDLMLTADKTKSAHIPLSPPSGSMPLPLTQTGTSSSSHPATQHVPDHHLSSPVVSSSSSSGSSSDSYPKPSPAWTGSADPKDPKEGKEVIPEHRGLGGLHRTPTCWTNCPNCPPNKKAKYHLIDVAYNCAEWSVVSNPLTQLGFTVTRVQRIQNELLWQRLCFEKQLMLNDQRTVNEQLLYHTSRCSVPIICEEGLDARLSMNGNFGRGMYFSDSPFKCNCYWSKGSSTSRYMFCCRVLLGDVKMYPKGKCEQLMREPPKINPKLGEPKFYDSVMGNLTGQNEFVVYNNHRVMPEYVLEYTPCTTADAHTPSSAPGPPVPSHMTGHMHGPPFRLVAGVKHLFHPTGSVFPAFPSPRKRRGGRKR